MPAKKTFWERVKKTSGCWLWTGAKRGGYGRIREGGRLLSVHRFSYELHFGPIPEGLKVLHKCDNPPCCRPDHLFLGTQADNVLDAASKGRHKNPVLSGERNPMAKLTSNKVAVVRAAHKSGKSKQYLEKKFSLSRRHLNRILSGERWPDDAPIAGRPHMVAT